MPCSICQHGERAAIEAAVSHGDSLRGIEGMYAVNKSSISRHMRQCLTGVSVAPQAVPMTLKEPMAAPAHVVNPQAHHLALQIHNMLLNRNLIIDPRMAVLEVVRLLLTVIRDAEEG